MNLNTVQQIENAIAALTTEQLAGLYAWLDQYDPQPIDSRLQADLASGHLDNAISRALDDEKKGRVQPPGKFAGTQFLIKVQREPQARQVECLHGQMLAGQFRPTKQPLRGGSPAFPLRGF